MNKVTESGLTEKEQTIMDKIVDAYNDFITLEIQHPSEQQEFHYAVHLMQGILATRIARRCFPDGWAIYKKK